ncbi:MAG: chemotaxis protein CheA [Nocardioidaceae bacterium]
MVEVIDEIVAEFLIESHENLDQLDQDLVELEREPGSRELLSSIFRTVHTIKGTCGFLAFNTLESVTHVGESLLARLRDGKMTLDPQITTALLEMVDAVRSLLANIEQTGAEGDADYSALVARMQDILDGKAPAAPAPEPVADADPESEPQAEAQPEPAPRAERQTKRAPKQAPAPVAEPVVEAVPEPVVEAAPEPVVEAAPAPVVEAAPTIEEPSVHHDEAEAPLHAQNGNRRAVADSSIRVDVDLLDDLMNLVGELVLTRNQLLQRAATRQDAELQRTAHRLNLIAGELQEGVMKTRMQPIDNVWNKLPRVVRDLCVSLGKSVRVEMEGRDTELDKTILEAMKDPLTHLVRNCVDHGIEKPTDRVKAGKAPEGVMLLRAFHEGGQVIIEITDDGAGIDPVIIRSLAVDRGMMTREAAALLSDRDALHLIFQPGFSTAKKVTNVSGRGVGMDVVKTNIERIGGTIDLLSAVGQGTTVRIKIPLTLAIIPALVVNAEDNLYAIPQVNVLELVRLEAEQQASRIETIQGTPVCRLRGELLPLVDLREQLGLPAGEHDTTFIAVLQADGRPFGVVVDQVRDTEEIVVKPLGKQLRSIPLYAGATIMGDGRVALILDANALARQAGMVTDQTAATSSSSESASSAEVASLLVLGLSDGRRVALPLSAVDRLEQFSVSQVERVGGHEVVQYRGEILPLVRLDQALQSYGEGGDVDPMQVVVCRHAGVSIGFVVAEILDIVEEELAVRTHLDTGGHQGSALVSERVTELVDIERAVSTIDPALLASAAV